VISVRRSSPASLVLAAMLVAADYASAFALVGLFGTSHRILLSATGSLVLHHDTLDSSHSHALADLLLLSHGDDGADGDHIVATRVNERISSRRVVPFDLGRIDRAAVLAQSLTPPGSAREWKPYQSDFHGLAPPSRRSIVLLI
jgi:hypothetical protein